MNKLGNDPKVKKTLVRNCEQRVNSSRKHVIREVSASSKEASDKLSRISQKENELSQPRLCSSVALANYLSDVKKSLPTPSEENIIDKGQPSSNVTKRLNFHFNDRIYKNLIELNASVEDVKTRNRRPTSTGGKRDLEPNIEDFYEDEEELDSPPNIPISKPKFKPVKHVDSRHLHKLIASFEDL